MRPRLIRIVALAAICGAALSMPRAADAQNAFTYQGELKQSGSPYTGDIDVRFELWSAAAGGSSLSARLGPDNVAVQNGLFTALADFGQDPFARTGNVWLQVYVRPSGTTAFTALSPRQQVTATPYALQTRGISVRDNGNVGIGLTNPDARLHLNTPAGVPVSLKMRSGGSWTAEIQQTPDSNFNFINGGQERMTLTPGGRLGVGETTPRATAHIKNFDLSLQNSALQDDDLIVESEDAAIGLYSANQGNAGSAIAFKEVTATGAIADTWGLVRESTIGGRSLLFTYGPSANYFNNPRLMRITAGGNVGIGLGNSQPESRLDVFTPTDPNQLAFPDAGGAATFNFANAGSIFPGVLIRTNSTNAGQRALEVRQSGRGTAGFFEAANVNGIGAAVSGLNRGSGVAVQGDTNGSGANAVGVWALASSGSNALPFRATQNGAGANIAIFQSQGSNRARIDSSGRGYFNNGTQTGGADIAEAFEVEGDAAAYAPGDVLVISTARDRTVTLSAEPYSTLVAGVHATKPGVLLSERHIDDPHDDTVPMGVVGVIPTKVTAEGGPIRRGDLLVTSSTPGHAMKANDRARMMGAILGKALEEFDGDGHAVIRVMVNVK